MLYADWDMVPQDRNLRSGWCFGAPKGHGAYSQKEAYLRIGVLLLVPVPSADIAVPSLRNVEAVLREDAGDLCISSGTLSS